MRVMDILSHATNRISEGEVLQLLNCNDADTTEARYMEVIERKTATLFQAGTRIGAVLAGSPAEIETAMADYGHHLGVAFQLVDDALDYRAKGDELGKNLGDDLAEGKPTLPVIRALAVGTPDQRALLREAIETGSRDLIAEVAAVIDSTDGIDYTISLARRHAASAKQAVSLLPESVLRASLELMADFAVARTY
jgi:octaprenyl-diphosphate synthase